MSSSVSPSFSEGRRFCLIEATREVVVVRRLEKYDAIVIVGRRWAESVVQL